MAFPLLGVTLHNLPGLPYAYGPVLLPTYAAYPAGTDSQQSSKQQSENSARGPEFSKGSWQSLCDAVCSETARRIDRLARLRAVKGGNQAAE